MSGVQPAVSDGDTRGTMQGVVGGRGEGRVGYGVSGRSDLTVCFAPSCHRPTRHAITRSPSPYLEPSTSPPDLLSLMVNEPYL